MKLSHTYRSIAFSLALIFGVFNVGVPIVVASCPMMKLSSTSMCAACYDDATPSAEQVTTSWDRSCCATVIAADRNTTEFVQSRLAIPDLSKSLSSAITPSIVQSFILHYSFSILHSASSPPLREDIPVFNSSLLI